MTQDVFGKQAAPDEVIGHSDELSRIEVDCQVDDDSHRCRDPAPFMHDHMLRVQKPPPTGHPWTRDMEATRGQSDLHGLAEDAPRYRRVPEDWGRHPAHNCLRRTDRECRIYQVPMSNSLARQSDTSMGRPPFACAEVLAVACRGRTSDSEVLGCHPRRVTRSASFPVRRRPPVHKRYDAALGTSRLRHAQASPLTRESPGSTVDWRLVEHCHGVSGARGATQRTRRIPCGRDAWASRPRGVPASAGRCRAPSLR